MLVPHSEADIGSFGPHWGKKEHTVFVHVPLMTGTKVSRSLGILASEGNHVSYVQADGSENMSSVLTG